MKHLVLHVALGIYQRAVSDAALTRGQTSGQPFLRVVFGNEQWDWWAGITGHITGKKL